MAVHVGHAVRLLNHALRVDEVGPALGPLRAALLRGALRLIALADRPVLVGEESEGKPELLSEGPVRLGRVERGAQDLGAGFLELWGSVTEPLALGPSARGVGLDEPPQDDPPAPEVLQLHRVPVLIGQGERRRLRAFGQHAAESSRPCASLGR
jgi:hypothetical protein